MADEEAPTLAAPVRLSLRAQLTIWFGISFGAVLATIVGGIVMLDQGRLFDPTRADYDWLIRLVGIGTFAALIGGILAAWVIGGVALEPLRRITETARAMGPERIEATRVEMPEVGVEVNEARLELNRALDRIEAGYQSQERFISNVSHELKTPIAVLLTEARRLQLQERGAEELSAFVGDVAEQMARLGKIVESFLTLARIDYEERLRKFEDFWFHDLLLEAVRRTRAQAQTHEVHVDLELPEGTDYFDRPSWGDPELISSAVENLIRNAIRFAPAGSSVRVSLESDPAVIATVAEGEPAEPARSGARVCVSDDGPGMPEALLATVFEPFKQADSEEGTGRGTGLGLAIAHRVATLHKGSIQALNRPSGEGGGRAGCTVEVALPFLSEQDWGPMEGDLEGARPTASDGPQAGS
ncbi:HAMP domain-containing histidine kinase [bacterium]|nr:HAMP domain-containing histidine kinase [bacterium]